MIGVFTKLMLVTALAVSAPVDENAGKKPGPQTTTPAAQASSAATMAAAYPLAEDDVLSITVLNFSNLSVPSLVIPPDGMISVPLLEPFSVTGMTTAEVKQTLTEKWRKYVINPAVNVVIAQKRRENVVFAGFVGRTGAIEYRQSIHILTALAEAGGATFTGDLSRVVVQHKTGEKQTLDLSHPETKGGSAVDIVLLPGDLITVPEKRTQFSVLGEVNKPGSYDYRDDMTVLDALTAVGGIKETADLDSATLIHEGKESKIDLDALLRHGDMSVNTKLAAGDRLMLPEIRNRVYVFGAVSRPGYYIFKAGDRVLDALNGSGGPTREGNLAKINVIRIDKAKNTATTEAVDIEKFLKKGDTKGNVALGPGDVLYVPDKKHKFGIQDIFGVLSGLNFVNSTMSIITHGLGNVP